MLGAGADEDRASLLELDRLALDVEGARPFEHDVDLVPLVRLLAIGLGRDEDVDPDLDARRGVDDLIAAVPGREPVRLSGESSTSTPGDSWTTS